MIEGQFLRGRLVKVAASRDKQRATLVDWGAPLRVQPDISGLIGRIGGQKAPVAEIREQFAPAPENIRAARLMVRGALASIDDAQLAELLTTELSSNAVQHAGTPFTVAVSHDDDGILTVEVHDHDPRLPVIPRRDPPGVRGRGLLLVDALSQEWGVTVIHDDGKTVWFRLSPTQV